MEVQITFNTLAVLVVIALVFDFMNGFHDAANSIATVVSTGVLKPHQAVAWAALFNFLAIAIFELKVAAMVGKGIVEPDFVDYHVIFGALVGAISWSVITWYYGIPSSSSHALIGGMIGAVVSKAGVEALLLPGILKIGIFILAAPLIGFAWSALLITAVSWLCFRSAPHRVDRIFRRLQLVSSALYSLGHGSNDAQKTMGIITLALYSAGAIGSIEVPAWVIVVAATALSLGTAVGGWRIMRTMGHRVVELEPVHGFAAEATAATVLVGTAHFGMPVSTTHVISSAIMGVGTSQGIRSVRWGVARNILVAWVLTIPASGLIAAISWLVLDGLHLVR